jgi:hypothetical protein
MNEHDLDKESATTPELVRTLIGEGHDREPLRHYIVFASTFLCLNTLAFTWLTRRGRKIVAPGITDIVLLGLATNRLSRLVTREKVTRVLRAPFTDVEPGANPEEVREHPRGTGLRRGLGELVTCPRCVAMWGASALSVLYMRSPSVGRLSATILSAAAISDFMNQRYAALKEQSA